MGDKPKTLPDSRSSEFWGDAEIIVSQPETVTVGQTHSWRQQGDWACCTSCPVQHGIFIDINTQEVRNGNVVVKETGQILYTKQKKQK